MRRGDSSISRILLGFRKPRRSILGSELAGEVDTVGANVQRFDEGDEVYGFTGPSLGAYAEYKCLPETGSLALKPTNLSFEEAAAVVDGASTALYFLKDKAKIQRGQRVLINGASGSIGSFAVQLAKYFGADVTGVCSTANLDWVASLGADRVIDYTKEEFTENGETYDIVFDAVNKSSFTQCRRSLTNHGCYLATGIRLSALPRMLWSSLAGGKRAIFGFSMDKTDSLIALKALIEAGKVKPVIDRRYSLEQIVEAHRYVDAGHKKGNVVITVDHNGET